MLSRKQAGQNPARKADLRPGAARHWRRLVAAGLVLWISVRAAGSEEEAKVLLEQALDLVDVCKATSTWMHFGWL